MICRLCQCAKYNNIKAGSNHMRSSCHQRGIACLHERLNVLILQDFMKGELEYQRRHCPPTQLNELVGAQRECSMELRCSRWVMKETLLAEWKQLSSLYARVMNVHYEQKLDNLGLHFMKRNILECILECTPRYKMLLTSGLKNFQTLCLNMASQQHPKCTMLLAV